MPKMPRKVQRRGPKRAHGSKPKLRCEWARCRRKTDVKNKPHILKIELVNLKATRKLHGSCGTVRFCSAACLSKCQLKQEALTTRGGREALTPEQCCMLFEVFVSEVQAPWAAVAFLLGIFMGERQGCVLQVRDNWFRGLSTPNPSITVPRVNKKTKPREIPLFHDFASLLLKWANPDSGPLRGGGSQWPYPGQKLQMGDERASRRGRAGGNLLFPGKLLGGPCARNYKRPVTARGWHGRFEAAQKHIASQRASAEAAGTEHIFDEVSLNRVSSHSMKKTSVTLMKQAGVATKVISLITGTSCRMLDNIYFQPSRKVQRHAAEAAFSSIAQGISSCSKEACADQEACQQFCTKCGRSASPGWFFCPACGTELVRP